MRFDFRRLKAAILCLMLGVAAVAQTPTPEQLKIFQSLPQDQQDALMQSILGGGKGDSTSSGTGSNRSDSKDDSRDSSNKDNERGNNATTAKERKTADGRTLRRSDEDPELRPFDYVLI